MIKLQILSQDTHFIKKTRKAISDLNIKNLRDCNGIKSLIESFKEEKPELLIIDSLLRDISAMEVIKKIKQIDEAIIIVVAARTPTHSFVDKAFRYGASDVLSLPYSDDYFKHTVLHRRINIKESQMMHFSNA